MARGPSWGEPERDQLRRVCSPNDEVDLKHWPTLGGRDGFWTVTVRRQGQGWSYSGFTRADAIAGLEAGLRESIERGRLASEALYKLRFPPEGETKEPQGGSPAGDRGASESPSEVSK